MLSELGALAELGALLELARVSLVVAAAAVHGTQHRLQIGSVYTISAYYWHFVDLVWLAVFATIFLVQ